MNLSDEIKRLHELHQAGALSDAEFEQAKTRVLASSTAAPGPGVNLNKGGESIVGSKLNTLRRSRLDRWLGGVCGGLALATGVEAWLWRLMFVLFTLTFGFGVAIYVLLWIFVPEE